MYLTSTQSTKDVSMYLPWPPSNFELVVQHCDGEKKRHELVRKSDPEQFLFPYIGQVKLKLEL